MEGQSIRIEVIGMAKRKTIKERNEELKKDGLQLHVYGMKFRAVPSPFQIEQFNKTIGCARVARNMYLAERKEAYKYWNETLSVATFKKFFNQLKQKTQFSWLKEVDKFAMESGIEAVEDAYSRFFKKQNGFPKFKKKHESKQSYSTKETNGNIQLDYANQKVKLPKVGWVKVKLSKKRRETFEQNGFNAKIKGATITRHSSGDWFISLKVEEVVPLEPFFDLSKINLEEVIGCDLGLTHFLIDSNGDKVKNHRFLNRYMFKLAKLQRQLKNKNKGSNNYKKLQQKIAKLHLKISDTRKDFLHKESRKLVNENQVIVLEDLNVKGMIKNKKLAKSIADVSWSTFVTFVKYKADWKGKKVVLINRFFPSSKECNGCKEKNTLLSLSDRTWVCPNCSTEHDRDVNAAQNIKKEGIRILEEFLKPTA